MRRDTIFLHRKNASNLFCLKWGMDIVFSTFSGESQLNSTEILLINPYFWSFCFPRLAFLHLQVFCPLFFVNIIILYIRNAWRHVDSSKNAYRICNYKVVSGEFVLFSLLSRYQIAPCFRRLLALLSPIGTEISPFCVHIEASPCWRSASWPTGGHKTLLYRGGDAFWWTLRAFVISPWEHSLEIDSHFTGAFYMNNAKFGTSLTCFCQNKPYCTGALSIEYRPNVGRGCSFRKRKTKRPRILRKQR